MRSFYFPFAQATAGYINRPNLGPKIRLVLIAFYKNNSICMSRLESLESRLSTRQCRVFNQNKKHTNYWEKELVALRTLSLILVSACA